MSSKISALSYGPSHVTPGYFVVADASANYRVTQADILTAPSGTQLTIISGTSVVGVDNAGTATLQVPSGKTITMWQAGSMWFQLDASSNWTVNPAGNVSITPTGTVTIGGWSGTAGYWGGAGTPTDVWSAVDRIAAVVSGGGATPIP